MCLSSEEALVDNMAVVVLEVIYKPLKYFLRQALTRYRSALVALLLLVEETHLTLAPFTVLAVVMVAVVLLV
jgi:hypothetical protein